MSLPRAWMLLAKMTVVVALAHATPVCRRALTDVLEGPACRSLGGSPNSMNTNDCFHSLRTLVSASASAFPCTTTVQTRAHRRLLVQPGVFADTFKGKLKCTFDMRAPLNVSDLSQPFVLDCKEIDAKPNLLWLWIILGILGGLGGLCCLLAIVGLCLEKYDAWRLRHDPSTIEQKEMKSKVPDYARSATEREIIAP